MLYAEHDFYTSKYAFGAGLIESALFNRYALRASQKIKEYTGTNIDENNVPECVKMCCCELAELFYKAEKAETENGGVKSETVGSWSKSYESTQERESHISKKIHDVIHMWLSGTGLLYRGIR